MESFFTLSNPKTLIDLNGRKPKFINHFKDGGVTHKLRSACYTIIEELADRNFDVPGFDVDFSFNEETAEIKVFRISSEKFDFRMVSDYGLSIKGKQALIFNDGSGSLSVYVGKDWEAEKKEFFYSGLVNRKHHGKSRISLHYDFRNHYFGSGEFKFTDDGGRNHDLEEGDPSCYALWEIEKELNAYMADVVLDICLCPPAGKRKQVFVEPEPEYLYNDIFKDSAFYVFKDSNYADQEEKGIYPSIRLVNLSSPVPKDHPLKKEMHDGFIYMEIATEAPNEATATKVYNYLGRERVDVFAVIPKNYNNFYVLDAGLARQNVNKWFDENPTEDRMPQGAADILYMEQANTMVPINEYKGGYINPIIICNRILRPEELSVVKQIRVEN